MPQRTLGAHLGQVASITYPCTGPDSLLPKPVPGTNWHQPRLPAHPAPIWAPAAPPGGWDREVLRRFWLRQGVGQGGEAGLSSPPHVPLAETPDGLEGA